MLLLTGFSLGCVAVMFLIVARDFGHLAVARVFLALLFATSAFLLNGVIAPEWRTVTSDIMTMLPALFWLLCQLAFAHRPRLFTIWGGLALYSFILPALTRPLGANDELSGAIHYWGWRIPTYAEYAVILHGMWIVIANWSDDLVESRRKLRGALLVIVGIAALWITISLNTGHYSTLCLPAVVSIVTLVVASLLLKGRKGVLLGLSIPVEANHDIANTEEEETATVTGQSEQVYDSESRKLHKLMDEGFYRTEKLTLSKLSEKIDLPEYKTRALINQTLGYRNFNDYINQLRIAEAGRRLVAEPETPILNIALDVGYRTLSSFNRAFKEILAQTPTAYRQSRLQDEQSKCD
ncbi:AraC family transcriptional regulator [Alkalimarinus sediminis]|uniref:Helix-turn-helix domain-containing protein n=1 Tax=Alkalimarinus sediminis TaxID=1632866 RepID=A0A9E8KQN4_9ALTE|nr:helix-turn-helix domain-containing protein [Alkalimarinus sediminis]UZW74977.1 helix-turn-helix domain-containing protein [Alkalimarinus sediminis]